MKNNCLLGFSEFKDTVRAITDKCEKSEEWEWNDNQYNEAYRLIGIEVKELVKQKVSSSNCEDYDMSKFHDYFQFTRGYYSLLNDASVLEFKVTDEQLSRVICKCLKRLTTMPQ